MGTLSTKNYHYFHLQSLTFVLLQEAFQQNATVMCMAEGVGQTEWKGGGLISHNPFGNAVLETTHKVE